MDTPSARSSLAPSLSLVNTRDGSRQVVVLTGLGAEERHASPLPAQAQIREEPRRQAEAAHTNTGDGADAQAAPARWRGLTDAERRPRRIRRQQGVADRSLNARLHK